MANFNKVILIGRLTRDPEVRAFANGGKVSKFGLAVNFTLSKKNQETGQWEGGESVFIDIEAFNRENGRQLADLVEQRLRKANQVLVEGRLRMNEWTSQDGQKRNKLLVVADNIEFLEPRPEGGAAPLQAGPSHVSRGPSAPARPPQGFSPGPDPYPYSEPEGPEGPDDGIPF